MASKGGFRVQQGWFYAESSSVGFMEKPSRKDIRDGYCTLQLILITYLLILITYYIMYLLIARVGFRGKSSRAGFKGWLVNHLMQRF